MKKIHAFILSLLLTLLIASNIFFFSNYDNHEKQTALITKVIDGDTLVIEGGEIIRLNNINTPEKNSPGYEEAKSFLSQFLNTSVEIERAGKDKYGRTLAQIYTPAYLNLEIVRQGLAKKFLVDNKELKEFYEAELFAINSEKGMWKKSPHYNCFFSEINPKQEFLVLKNSCGPINVKDWTITDESRKQYKFPNITINEIKLYTHAGKNNETDLFWNSNAEIWNNDRDSLYLFDREDALVHYQVYGY